MAECHPANDRSLIVNSIDLTDWVKEMELSEKVDTFECTTTGADSKQMHGGLIERELKVTFIQDYGLGAVHRALQPLLGKTVAVQAKPKVGGTTRYTGSVVITENVPIPGGTGSDVAEFEVTWPGSGDWTVVL